MFVSRGQWKMYPARTIHSNVLVVVRSGILNLQEDGQPFEVREGNYIILYAGRHHGGLLPYSPGLKFYWVHFMINENYGQQPDSRTLSVHQTSSVSNVVNLYFLFHRLMEVQQKNIAQKNSV